MIVTMLLIILILLPLDMLMLLQYHTARGITILALPRAAQLVGLAHKRPGPLTKHKSTQASELRPSSFTLSSDSTSASVSKSE